jgi:hypothetical protein
MYLKITCKQWLEMKGDGSLKGKIYTAVPITGKRHKNFCEYMLRLGTAAWHKNSYGRSAVLRTGTLRRTCGIIVTNIVSLPLLMHLTSTLSVPQFKMSPTILYSSNTVDLEKTEGIIDNIYKKPSDQLTFTWTPTNSKESNKRKTC